MNSLIRLSGIAKNYPRGRQNVPVLRDLNLSVVSGEMVALTGPSGSGKSTCLNLLAGFDRPTAGEVWVGGHRIDRLSNRALAAWRASGIGFVFQFYNLFPTLDAARNVEVPLLLTGLSASQRRTRAMAALELVGLPDRANHLPSELSGGQQQRVAIARALVADAPVLLCDEPTGDLDRVSADEIVKLLRMLSDAAGKTIVMVTHDLRAAECAHRQVQLDKGCVLNSSAAEAA